MLKFIQRVWLPRTLGGLATWFANFNLKFAGFAAALGLASETTNVSKWNDSVQWLNDAEAAMKANGKGLAQFRDETLYAEKGDPAPADPVTSLPPAPDFERSIIIKLTELVDKIEAADAYTPEMGVQLGIVKPPGAPVSPDSVKPTADVSAALTGYLFAVVVGGRGESDQWEVQIRLAGSENWTSAGRFTGKAANITVTPTTPGLPQQLQVRIQLKKKNENYGQVSDAVSTTVNP